MKINNLSVQLHQAIEVLQNQQQQQLFELKQSVTQVKNEYSGFGLINKISNLILPSSNTSAFKSGVFNTVATFLINYFTKKYSSSNKNSLLNNVIEKVSKYLLSKF